MSSDAEQVLAGLKKFLGKEVKFYMYHKYRFIFTATDGDGSTLRLIFGGDSSSVYQYVLFNDATWTIPETLADAVEAIQEDWHYVQYRDDMVSVGCLTQAFDEN